jgi:hypothetical protein
MVTPYRTLFWVVVTNVLAGERALEQLNYSLIKNRAWCVQSFTLLPRVSFQPCLLLSQPDHVVSA